jgi:hypothetical protein
VSPTAEREDKGLLRNFQKPSFSFNLAGVNPATRAGSILKVTETPAVQRTRFFFRLAIDPRKLEVGSRSDPHCRRHGRRGPGNKGAGLTDPQDDDRCKRKGGRLLCGPLVVQGLGACQ